ncbi:hypothetical protein BJ546DRAFT_564558 [Cryomyces antarcticus]
MDSFAPPPVLALLHLEFPKDGRRNGTYSEWFYVNIYTKQSQWDKPTEPVYPPTASGAPPGPPPTYNEKTAHSLGPEKGALPSNNPYGAGAAGSGHNLTDDERYARQLQAEEDARAQGRPVSRGAADAYHGAGYGQSPSYGQAGASPYGQQELPPRPADKDGKAKGGFLGKLLGKASSGGHSSQPPYGGGGYSQQQPQYYGGPPQGQYGYQPQQRYYGQGGYPQQQYMQQPPRRGGGGMGVGGAAALGVGGGLLGGMLLADAMDDNDGGVSIVLRKMIE